MEGGFLSVEWVLTVPVMALLAALVVAAGLLVRDVLVLQEAARVGARVASTTAGDAAVSAAVHDAAPELGGGLVIRVHPRAREPGEHVEVRIATTRRYGPLSQRLAVRSTARVEPILEGGGPTGPRTPFHPVDPTAPRDAGRDPW
ncbi:MAG: TadE/TadG family type IV pilus assembly protein [Nitriliruptor sp.]